MAKKKIVPEEIIIEENISTEPLDEVMSDRYAIYAKYVIQDRAIPDVRDGLKPVQRRILFSMFSDGNTINKPTRKCAHTVGAVMGKYHPHGDSSIYEALARMSQDWKVRYPLVDFQGNNGSIDGDSPAAYRYTESRLSELSNEMLREIDKDTVDMTLTFDDTAFEPVVLPSRFPNLLVNGSEGIAVALATEIPPHNLKEVIDATIYRINHKNATVKDLMEIVPGPDFPTGGTIYKSDGLNSIYLTGRGRIEVAAKAEIVDAGPINQIIITEIPYKVVKIGIVYEIDKIRHSKAIDGILEVRDETDFDGIRIVVDIRKNAPADLILAYLMNKTSLRTSYSANMVAIVDGRPKTLNLLDFIDAYVNHQVEVVTRRSNYDLRKYKGRLHIVDGLITATININEVVEIIRSSKDKQDSKANLIKRFSFSNEQAEAIVMMPLYKLSHTDAQILENEKLELEKNILRLEEILADEQKLNKVLIKELKEISYKYGDDRKTIIEEKVEDTPIDKRLLISKDKCFICVTRDGYLKRSTIKSYNSSVDKYKTPEMKQGDAVVCISEAWTTDTILCFTDAGNFIPVPVYKLEENKWKDRGGHINALITLPSDEKIIKVIISSKLRKDIFAIFLSRKGQIKRTPLDEFERASRNRPTKCIRLNNDDELVDVKLSTGDANVIVFSEQGNFTMFNENDLLPLSTKASGVKAMANFKNQKAVGLYVVQKDEHDKIVLITDKGCERIFDTNKAILTPRLGKVQNAFPCFKSDVHKLVKVLKAVQNEEQGMNVILYNQEIEPIEHTINDFRPTDLFKYAKRNIEGVSAKTRIKLVFTYETELVNESLISQPVIIKKAEANLHNKDELLDEDLTTIEEENTSNNEEEKEESKVEQISLFDDF